LAKVVKPFVFFFYSLVIRIGTRSRAQRKAVV
jgi:hypothetical protein